MVDVVSMLTCTIIHRTVIILLQASLTSLISRVNDLTIDMDNRIEKGYYEEILW